MNEKYEMNIPGDLLQKVTGIVNDWALIFKMPNHLQ